MRKLREVLRLKHERGLSHRAIAQACAIGLGTVTLYALGCGLYPTRTSSTILGLHRADSASGSHPAEALASDKRRIR